MVIVEAVPAPSKIASMYRNTKSELPGGLGLGEISLLRLSMTRKLNASLLMSIEVAQLFRLDAAEGGDAPMEKFMVLLVP